MKWVIVADNGRSRFFAANGSASFDEVEDFVHPEGQLAGRDQTSDAAGRRGVSSMEDGHRAEQHERAFAKTIADRARKALDGGECQAFVLAAPPRFLGRLRDAFDGRLADKVVDSVSKDFTRMQAHDLPGALEKAGIRL